MKKTPYHDRDYAFGKTMLTLRTKIGLTQAGLANFVGVSRRAVGDWEAGNSYPKTKHLKKIIALAAEQHAFASGHEIEEIRTLWRASHQKVLLDEAWLHGLINHQEVENTHTLTDTMVGPHENWIDAPAIPAFYGRRWELDLLTEWIVNEPCRVVSVIGFGGIGKSTLAANFIIQSEGYFELVIWRSLRDRPGFDVLLDSLLQVIAPRMIIKTTTSPQNRQSFLLECMRGTRILFVLDNLEAVLEEGEVSGQFLPGYEDFGRFLQLVAETEHQSCVLLTSREKLVDLVPYEGKQSPVRTLRLSRLDGDACTKLLMEKGVKGDKSDRARLIDMYVGNPLALKIVAQTIVHLFEGETAPFLKQGGIVYGGIRELLSEQFDRLSDLEQSVLLWLAILREPATLDELLTVLVSPVPRFRILEAIESLYRRSLIERGQKHGSFTLQSVVLEYATARFIAEAGEEILNGKLVRLIEHGIELASSKEYIRQTQQRLLVAPLLTLLQTVYSRQVDLEKHLHVLLDNFSTQSDHHQGYGPANMLVLLREERGHLRGLNLTGLAIRGMFLQGIEMQDTTLAGTFLRDTVFTSVFDTIWAVAISSTGQYRAAGSGQGKVQVWREEGKTLHLSWQAHGGTVWSLAFSPDERLIATGSWDGSVKLWEVESGNLLWTNWHTNNDIHCLAFSPDGHILASGGDDATVRLWDAVSGATLKTLAGNNSPVHSLAWSSDGNLLAVGRFDGGIRIWEQPWAGSNPVVRSLVGHQHWVTGLAFAPDGRMIASGSFDGTLKLWDVESLDLLGTLQGHTGPVLSIAWRPEGDVIASSSFDQTIWLWDVERMEPRKVLHGHSAAVYSITFTPDNHSLFSSSDDGTLRLWDVDRGECVQIVQGSAAALYDLAWSPDGTQLASSSSDTQVTIWDVAQGTKPKTMSGHFWIVLGVAWSPDGRLLASSAWDNTVRIWDSNTGTELQTFQQPEHPDNGFQCVAWSPDGKLLASGSYLWGLHVWDMPAGTLRWIGREQSTRIRRVVWSPDGMEIASCGDDGSVFLWNAEDGRQQDSLRGHNGMALSVAWSPDGTKLASGGGSKGSGEVFVWGLPSKKLLQAWIEPGSIVFALAWDLDGELLLSGGSDGMIRWWNSNNGECLRVLKGHQGTVQSLSLSPDGKVLASSGDDNAIQLWDFHSGKHLQTLRHDRPYERLNITGIQGLNAAQKASLHALGAIEYLETGE